MSEYDEIHKSEATPVKVGVDLSGLISACTAVESDPSRHPSGNIAPDAVEPLIVPWKIYWNDATSAYNLYDPKVILPDGSMITATDTTGITEENTYYCRVEKDGDTYTAEIVTESTKTEDTVSLVKICEITESGEVKQFHIGYVTVSLGTTLVGDTDSSEVIHGDVQISGQLDPDDEDTSCGITVTTVSARDASGDDPARPPRVILNIKDRNGSETDWGAHEIKYTDASGASKTAHVFGCADIEIRDSGGGGQISNVIGSDYIEVDDKTEEGVTKRQVKAKILTGAASGETSDTHALLTHDTEQIVKARKIFTGEGAVSSSDHVDVDGPNGKIEVVDADQQRKIKLDAGNIPSDCSSKVIGVKELTVTHPRADSQGHTEDTFHILSCDDVSIKEGDVLGSFTSGTPTSSSGWTTTPVTVTLGNGTTLTPFNVKAKDGTDGSPGTPGEDGDDGASVTSATAGTPTVSGNTTTTPITFGLSDGTTVGPVNVTSKNGTSATGTIYIDVSSTAGTEGQVSAKTTGNNFLVTNDTEQSIKAKKIFTGPNGGSTIEVDGQNGRMVISNGSKSITLDLADIPNGCVGALAVNELTFTDANGNEQTYHGLFCDDIDLPQVVQKTIAAGDGISVTVSGNTITITNTRTSGGGSGGQTTSGYTGTKQVVTDVTYDESTHKLLKKVETWTYENGLLKTVVVPSSMTEITQAVEETV